MNPPTIPHVLCVDDEPQVLESLKLNLRRLYTVSTATSGEEALNVLDRSPDLAVIVSDMRMPAMNGAVFLAKARHKAPDAVRMLLTGHSDIDAAIAAVNNGQIFRFLTKPCMPTVLLDAVASAVTQHRLVTSERVLLEQTLHGSVKALTEILGLVNPIAFGRTKRICKIVDQLADQMQISERWQLKIAAMLSQIGHVTLPAHVAEKAYYGLPLTQDEEQLIQGLPAVVEKLLNKIPRLEAVIAILRSYLGGYNKAIDARALSPAEMLMVRDSANLLRLAVDYDVLESTGDMPLHMIIQTLRGCTDRYAQNALDALEAVGAANAESEVRTVAMPDLAVGMIFAEDVKTPNGVLLVARGYQITERVLDRMRDLFPAKHAKVQWAVYR